MSDRRVPMDLAALSPFDVCCGALAFAFLLDRIVRNGRLPGPLVVAAVAAGGMALTGRPLSDWLGVGAVAAGVVGGRLLFDRPATRVASRGSVVVGLAAALAAGWAAVQAAGRVESRGYIDTPGRVPLRERTDFAFVTDRGRPLPVFEPADGLPDGEDPSSLEAGFLRQWGAAGRVLRAEGPDPRSNCHGWTFTGGKAWVRSEDVDGILADNRYRPTGSPRRGDVAVYRDPQGRVCHTGVVVGRSQTGAVLVESKWAWAGRFVHPADAQPYSARFEFVRSRRQGNLLTTAKPPRADGGPVAN